MIRRPPRSTLDRSSAASDVYKRQVLVETVGVGQAEVEIASTAHTTIVVEAPGLGDEVPVSYTHLRAHETVLDIVCRLLLDKKQHRHKQPIVWHLPE